MATKATYKCKECKDEFDATTGNLMLSTEFRCDLCDHQVYIKNGEDDIKKCPKCNGEMKKNLNPMCPSCKKRNVEFVKNLIFID
ncbi:MAG: hypothetical protein WCF92_01195 [bacterium]